MCSRCPSCGSDGMCDENVKGQPYLPIAEPTLVKVDLSERAESNSTHVETKCPSCGSETLYRDGLRYLKDGSDAQRWLCRSCGYRFSKLKIKSVFRDSGSCTIGVSPNSKEYILSKPLQNHLAGDITTIQVQPINNSEGKIVEFLWWMKKQGYKEATIVGRDKKLRRFITLGADLNNPESIKETIANQTKWKESQKETMVNAYDLYRKWKGLTWQKPRYKAVRQLPFIPQEREIDDLIASCTKEIALFLQIAKETGARAGEIYRLQWTDIDLEGRTINIIAEKGSNPRCPKMSIKLFNMLGQMLRKGDIIFCKYKSVNTLRRTFDRQRKTTAHKLANPRLQKITFHTLRHWKGSTEYHKTKDILHVMQVLGHKNIKNTLLYTQLIQVEKDDQFTCKVAKEPKEIAELIELGYEFVCSHDGFQFFRKRK